MRISRLANRSLAAIFMLVALAQVEAAAQEQQESYQLGPGDVLQLNVLQRPDLDRTLTLRPDGTVIVPSVGPVQVSGLTVGQAEEMIRQRLRLYDPTITGVSVTVTEYNALRIYVLGAVNQPGSYTFSHPPNLWDVIRTAGGPREGANLSVARVIRRVEGTTQTQTYDLSPLLTGSGDLPDIPLQAGDTVVIPSREETPTLPAAEGVQVFGSVGTPQTVPISQPTRLMTLLMMAGTPLQDAKLKEIWWVHHETDENFRAHRINMELFTEKGNLAGNPLVYPGDTVRVPASRPGWLRANLPIVLSTLTSTAAILLAISRSN
jgi:polysaccharide export outer membrane protein